MNKKHVKGWTKHWDFIVVDVVCLQSAFLLVYWLRYGLHNPYLDPVFRYLVGVLFVCQLLAILFSGNYSGILRRNRYDELYAVLKYSVLVLSLAAVYMFAVKISGAVSRLQTGLTMVFYFAIDWAARVVLKRYIRNKIIRERGGKSLLLVTSANLVGEVLEKLFRNNTYCDFHVSKIILLDDELPEELSPGVAGYGVPVSLLNEKTVQEITHDWVDEVFLYQPDDRPLPTELINAMMTMGIAVNFTAEALDRWPNTDLRKLGQYKVLTIGHRFANAGALAVKRFFDILGGIVGCILTGIIFLFVAPAIHRADPGPVIFTQVRIGQNGRRFKIHKFRSMYMDAEERKAELMARNKMQGLMFKVDNDPRILPGIGNFIRKTSLDEFPQFFDCLIGNLSLVGWRPATVDEWNQYAPEHRIRASMKPGITGMWQVSGRNKITDFEEIVQLDREYIENWSLGLDLMILLKTIVVVLSRQGAE